MSKNTGIGVYIEKARYVPANTLFKENNRTEERTVNKYEIILFLKDGGSAVINGKRYPIFAGSIRFLKPGDHVYSYRFNEIYVFHFTTDDSEKSKGVFGDIPSFMNFLDTARESEMFKAVIEDSINKRDFSAMCNFWRLMYYIKKHQQPVKSDYTSQKTDIIKDYIKEHISEKITLSELSEHFFLHPIYLQRKFKKDTGITPGEYVQKIRINHSKTLLLSTDLKINEISDACGFCNTSYFIKIFKETCGITPTAFRNCTILPENLI